MAFSNGSVSTVMPVSLMPLYLSDASGAGSGSGEEVFTVLCKARGYRHTRLVAELQTLARNRSGLLLNPGRAWHLSWLTN